MKRLTTDNPNGNFETMLNYVYGKDGFAHIRSDGAEDDVPLTAWAKAQCLAHGCDEFPAETPEEIDEELCDCQMDCPECPIALAYCFACQAVHLRDRLKRYEDILFDAEGRELVTLDQLRALAVPPSDEPLTPAEKAHKGKGSSRKGKTCILVGGLIVPERGHWEGSMECENPTTECLWAIGKVQNCEQCPYYCAYWVDDGEEDDGA